MKGPESDPVRQQRDTSAPSCRRRSSRAAGRETPLELIREANQTGTRPPGSGVERTRQRWDILRDVVDQGTTARGSARYMPVMARIPSTAVTRREGQGVHLMRRRSSTMPLETVVNIQGLLNRRKKMSARRPRQTHQTALRSKTSPETENEDDQAAGGGTARWRVKQSRPAILKSRQSMSDMSVQSVDSGHHGNRHSKVSWGGLDIERVTMRFTRDGEVSKGHIDSPANTTNLLNVWSMLAHPLLNFWAMLGQRRRRWANICQTMSKCVVFADSWLLKPSICFGSMLFKIGYIHSDRPIVLG